MRKRVPMWLYLLTIYFNIVVTIFFGWSLLHIYQHGGSRFSQSIKDGIISVARLPTEINLVLNYFSTGYVPGLMQIKNDQLKSGPSIKDKTYKTNDLLLVSSFDPNAKQSAVKLVRLSDGKTLHQWIPDIKQLLDRHNPANKKFAVVNEKNYRIVHPLLLNNGEVIFNDNQVLVKMDKAGKTIWFSNHVFHHSIELDAEGNIWSPSVIENSKLFKEYSDDFRDDALTKVAPADGKILFQKSIAQILIDNGYQAFILGVGSLESDPIHVNDIQPALTDSKYWLKGDLLISIRNRSTVFLYRPSTNKILWLQTGPWLNQHDCDFLDDHRIGVFGNNMIRNKSEQLLDGHNEEVIYDFSTSETSTPYTALFKNSAIATKNEGTSRVLDNGDLYVEETNNGRIFVGDSLKVKLEYAERLNDKEITMFSWCRYMTAEEFSKVNFLNN